MKNVIQIILFGMALMFLNGYSERDTPSYGILAIVTCVLMLVVSWVYTPAETDPEPE